MTRVHASDGSLLAEYARERRLYLPIQAVPKLRHQRLPRGRGQEFLRAWRPRLLRHRARRHAVRAELRHRPPSAGRLDHHPAGRQELPADQRGVVHPQDQGSAARDEDRAHLFQGQDPRALSQRNLSRLRRLRHRGRLAPLFRQVGARTDDRGSRLSRGAAEGAHQLPSVPPARARDRAAQLRHRSHGRERLHHRTTTARRRRRSRSPSPRGRPARTSSPANISPRKCAATSTSATARRSSTKAACRCAPRSIRRCR